MRYNYIGGESEHIKSPHSIGGRIFPFWVMVYVIRGQYFCNCGGIKYLASEGEAVVIPPQLPHEVGMCETGLISWCHISFDEQDNIDPTAFSSPFLVRGERSAILKTAADRLYALADRTDPAAEFERDRWISDAFRLFFSERQPVIPHEAAEDNWRQSAAKYISAHLSERLDLDMLSKVFYLSKSSFCHRFKTQFGIPPMEYVVREKIERARLMLESGRSVKYIASALRFTDVYYLSRQFKKYTGVSPSEYKRSRFVPK